MKTYKFKTLCGFLRSCSGQVTAEHVFSGRAYLSNGRGDFSLFQCFYFDLYFGTMPKVSNSLSGSAFSSVVREYLRKYC